MTGDVSRREREKNVWALVINLGQPVGVEDGVGVTVGT